MSKEYFRSNEGCFIRSDLFEQFRHLAKPNETGIRYTHKNEKKAYQIRMLGGPGAISSWQWKTLNKIPDEIKHYKDLGNGYIKIPLGLASFYHQSYIRNYDEPRIIHPRILRNSYDYQTNAINQLLTRTIGLLHASTGSGKTQIIADITSRLDRNTLIVVQNLTQMAQMVKDIEMLLGVTPTQVSGKVVSKKKAATFYPHITVCSIDSRDKVNPKDFGLILLDECLDGGSIVSTDKGLISIKDIVENKLEVNIKSYNQLQNTIEYKPVINFWKKKTSKKMYRIKYIDSSGKEKQLECTENHPIFVQGKGFTETKNLVVGDNLLTDLTSGIQG